MKCRDSFLHSQMKQHSVGIEIWIFDIIQNGVKEDDAHCLALLLVKLHLFIQRFTAKTAGETKNFLCVTAPKCNDDRERENECFIYYISKNKVAMLFSILFYTARQLRRFREKLHHSPWKKIINCWAYIYRRDETFYSTESKETVAIILSAL